LRRGERDGPALAFDGLMNLAGLGRAVAVEQLELAVAESLNDPLTAL